MEYPILSLHIPKTGGESLLRSVWMNAFPSSEIIIDNGEGMIYTAEGIETYSTSHVVFREYLKCILTSFPGGRDVLRTILRLKQNRVRHMRFKSPINSIPPDVKVIHGHFGPSQGDYSQFFPNSPWVVILRDPWERCISHYLHILRDPRIEIKPEWFIYDMSIEEFALHPDMLSYYSRYLSPLPLSDFTVVGILEETENLLSMLRTRLSISGRYGFQHYNRAPTYIRSSIPRGLEGKFKSLARRDYDLYQEGLRVGCEGRVPIS